MPKFAWIAASIMASAFALHAPATVKAETLMDLMGNRAPRACPRYQQSPADRCNIVVHRSGGNPTQDMTGSIGHAKSWQGNGGPGCKTICRFTGTQY